MDMHENARTTRHSRRLMMRRLTSGWSVAAVAAAQGVSPKTVRKWRDRFAAHGEAGLLDRSSRPHRSPTRLTAATEAEIEELRRQRLSGSAIARRLARPVSTIGVVLRRRGLGRLAALDTRPPVIRYQRETPGELIHIDTKKLGRISRIGHRITGDRAGQSSNRGIGWEHLHVAIDDASRLAYTELLADERKHSAVAFLGRARAWFASLGVTCPASGPMRQVGVVEERRISGSSALLDGYDEPEILRSSTTPVCLTSPDAGQSSSRRFSLRLANPRSRSESAGPLCLWRARSHCRSRPRSR
jgi:transposase-like protein